jgi:tRNA modification GTPase
MAAFAAVMTGRGSGAIAAIQLVGDSAEAVLAKVFRCEGDKPIELTTGRILLGHILDGDEVVDQVTLGCEGASLFAIHCHGNPLIVERIMGLLQGQGVTLLAAEQMLAKILATESPHDSIAAEAKLALTTVKTVEGAEILAHQIEWGLSAKVRQWQRELGATPLEQVAAEAEQILRDSVPAQLIIAGCTIALIGPPGTGKSTLLNTLAGRDKAVVTAIRGTTRDWISAEIHIPPLAATIIDTAGLDAGLAAGDDIGRAAQRKSVEVLACADLALLVLDLNQPADQLGKDLLDRVAGKKTLLALNKADLSPCLDAASIPASLGSAVRISARQASGIEELIRAIHQVFGTAVFNTKTAVAFTPRQCSLLEQVKDARSKSQANQIISQLLIGPPMP